MKKQETVPFAILQDQLRINRLHRSKIYWYETFIEYIEKNNSKLYKKANVKQCLRNSPCYLVLLTGCE